MKHTLVIGGSGGLGHALCAQLVAAGHHVVATGRSAPERVDLGQHYEALSLDVCAPPSIAALVSHLEERVPHLDQLLYVAGMLHTPSHGPEKRVEHLSRAHLLHSFEVNAVGPALVAQAVLPLLLAAPAPVIANLSARVGSIEDNGLGGWYSYRASKAAQNQLTRTLSIELRRRKPSACVVALHPGTVDTPLSRPFQRNVPAHQLFPADRAARQLLDILAGLTPVDTGRFIAWDGADIPW